MRLNKAVAESQSASGSEKAADEALVWHENPMASQLSSSSPIEISIESTDSQDQQEQSTDTAVVAMPMIEGKITGKSTKDIVESTRRRKGRSGSDDYSDVVVEQKALELSLWTLSMLLITCYSSPLVTCFCKLQLSIAACCKLPRICILVHVSG